MDNEYLYAAQRTLVCIEEVPPEIRAVSRIELAQVNATVAVALETREANLLAREAAARQDTANLIAYAALVKQKRHVIPRKLLKAIDKALGFSALTDRD